MIKVHIPPLLQPFTSNRDTVLVQGTTVRACLEDLKKQFPGLREWLDETNPIAWVTLNGKIIGIEETTRKIAESDELQLVLILAGG